MKLSCKEVTRLVSQGMDRRLPLGRRLALRLHFVICDGCSNFRKQMQFLRDALRQLSSREP